MSHEERRLPSTGSSTPVPEEYVAGPSAAASYTYPSTPSSAGAPPITVAASMRGSLRLSPLERWALDASDSRFNALAGAVGGFTSGIVTCPLDVIKTKLQAQGGFAAVQPGHYAGHHRVYRGLVGTASVIWKEEGIRGMYRGLGPIILGYLPTWAVWFTVYNKSKTFMGQYHGTCRGFLYLLSLACPGGPASCLERKRPGSRPSHKTEND